MIANSVLAMGSSNILLEMFSSVGENQLFSVVVSQLPIWENGSLKYVDVDQLLREQGAIAVGFAVKEDNETIRRLNPEPTTELTTGKEIIYYLSRRRLYK